LRNAKLQCVQLVGGFIQPQSSSALVGGAPCQFFVFLVAERRELCFVAKLQRVQLVGGLKIWPQSSSALVGGIP
jgi:hypothetical protein